MTDVSSFDFQEHYRQKATEVTPLNCFNSVLVALHEAKRYFVYDYVQGCVVKEILALRGSIFHAMNCPRVLKFDLLTNPDIIVYNQSVIRRVDILTFEIKKNIDFTKLKFTPPPQPSYTQNLAVMKVLGPKPNSTFVPADLHIQEVFLMPKLRLSPQEREALSKQ
jgi:hypothetical protein